MRRIVCGVLGGLFFIVLSYSSVWAQATAQISGSAKDQSGAVLPGVEIKATQTETGITREAVTNESGLFVLPNLPIGPYRLEAALPGFRTFVQTGIVLVVNSNPDINVVLGVGQVTEQVEVQANAALVETRNAGVGTVMENTSILELPLNGRSMIDLVSLSGATAPAPTLTGVGGWDPFSKGNVSVAGGLNSSLNYTLDGAYHNNPFDNSYLSMPFPDALQEFKVETGASGVGNGVRASGSVSLVTKSGANDFHGDAFEFVRNGSFNARNAFAAKRDSIKRNQFGGVLGGPIVKNRLFFFGGYQGTTIRTTPTDQTFIIPTPAMSQGDFTAFASPACNGGRQITLKAPFVNNRVDPALMSKAAVRFNSRLQSLLKSPPDACGLAKYGFPAIENDHTATGRIDYQRSASHSIFGRYLLDTTNNPAAFDISHDVLNALFFSTTGRSQSFAVGDTYLFSTNVVNAARLSANRVTSAKIFTSALDTIALGPGDIGIKAFTYYPHRITGAVLPPWPGGGSPGISANAIFAANDDLSVLRGNHQLTFGVQVAGWLTTFLVDSRSQISTSFTGGVTGLPLSDFFMGNVQQFQNGTVGLHDKQQKYLGLYTGDTWKLNQKVTLSYGLRWEPYFPMRDVLGATLHFDANAVARGVKSTVFSTTPPGVSYPGDPGFPGDAGMYKKWWNFSPRFGLAWDVNGDGRTAVRVSGGSFYDFPATYAGWGFSNSPPFTVVTTRQGVSFDDPWANEPGGDPFPVPFGRGIGRDNAIWPGYATFYTADFDTKNMHVAQWNLSIQRQIHNEWLISATYLGNQTRHLWVANEINPAVFLGLGPCTLQGVTYSTCSTTANTNQRRRLSLANPATGQYFGAIAKIDAGGTANYNGLLLSVERRASRGLTVSANYTWSHCISDPMSPVNLHAPADYQMDPDSRHRDRGNCAIGAADRRQVFNTSAVVDTPQFSSPLFRGAASGWRISPILKIVTGDYMTVTDGQERALTGISAAIQRPDLILASPYGNKSVSNYLNPSAFAQPALGTYGNVGAASILGPAYWQFDAALARTFQVHEAQKVELRVEAFNVTNSFRMNDPIVSLNNSLFGKVTTARDPRIMQFALKYVF